MGGRLRCNQSARSFREHAVARAVSFVRCRAWPMRMTGDRHRRLPPPLPPPQESYTVNPDSAATGDRPSPYAKGLFRVALKFGDTYPREAPEVAFTTRVWHPQVDVASGKPCVDYLRTQWKDTLGVRDVLVMLRQLLASPSACAWGRGGVRWGRTGWGGRPSVLSQQQPSFHARTSPHLAGVQHLSLPC